MKRWSAPASTKTRLSALDRDALALDLELARAVQDDVELVMLVRLLAVRLRRDEHVHADLERGRLVDDLVAAVPGLEPAADLFDVERVHGGYPPPAQGSVSQPSGRPGLGRS